MSKTVLIILSTVLVLGLTLLVTNILSRRKKTDLADWEVGGRDLPYYVVIGTQFATAMGAAFWSVMSATPITSACPFCSMACSALPRCCSSR